MNEIERLTKLRHQEQEVRDYPKSSRWYTGTGLAIKYLELAETATTPSEVFRNSWYGIYNLYMMIHKRGESENIALSNWISEAQASQKVRQIALSTPTVFFEALIRAQNSLLFDAETKKPRDAKQLTDQWLFKRKKGKELSPEKASAYLLLIGRDLRNAISHPKQDPSSPAIKKALKLAAEIFLPLASAATEAMLERPPEGTTGKVIAYRSFLYPFLKNSDSSFSDYYLERLFPEQELSAFPEDEAKAALKEINKELTARRKDLVRADDQQTLERWCGPVVFRNLRFATIHGVKIVTDEGVIEPTAVIKKADGRLHKEYKGKEAGRDVACLIWVLPWSTSLDAVSDDEESSGKTVMEIAQSALTRADVDWAFLTNGQKVRLLSKTTAHKPRSFLEIDLAAIAERWIEREAQLAFRYLLGLCSEASIVEKDAQERTRLERALRESERHGKEISDELKKNVFSALEELGEGFLAYLRSQPAELDAWRQRQAPALSTEEFLKSQGLLTDIYQESLSLMYRLLFLFYAEGRDLLPMDDETYRDSYSLESIRDDIIATHDDPDPKSFFSPGSFELWGRLTELFKAVDGGWQNIIPAYNGGLFDPEHHPFLETFKINDQQLAQAIDLLSRTRPGAVRGEGRKKITYRDLDIRHLGSIYEGILEYHAEIADQEKVIIKRGTGGKAAEEYVAPAELTSDEQKHLNAYREAVKEDEENPVLPRGCKVTGLVERGEYYLIFGGRESKRKSSGSYYTPDYIVQYIVENTLGHLVRGETRPKSEDEETQPAEPQPLSSDEILELKVLDPAMGSGHFLVAATEYLARAYGTACIREGKDKDGVMSDEDFVHYKRIIAERCIYGIDINPMAVDLAKLSMWLFTMDKGRPLSFVNHHLKPGHAVIGARIKDLGTPPEPGDDNKILKRTRRDTRTGNLFEVRFRERVPLMVSDIFGIMEKETLEIADVRAKKALEIAVEEIKRPFENIADIWVGLYFGERADDYNALLMDVESARSRKSASAAGANAFHWELEFPEIWFDQYGNSREDGGFDAIVGNPPYLRIQGLQTHFKGQLDFYAAQYRSAVKRFDIYLIFAEKGFELLANEGRLCIICPHKFINSDFGSGLRDYLVKNQAFESLISFGNNSIFEKASSTYTGLLFLSKRRNSSFSYYEFPKLSTAEIPIQLTSLAKNDFTDYQIKDFTQAPWMLTSSQAKALLTKLQQNSKPLGEVFETIFQGVVTGADEIYMLEKPSPEGATGVVEAFSPREGKTIRIERGILKPMLKGEDVFRYSEPQPSKYCIYPYQLIDDDTVILDEDELSSRFPLAYEYLSEYKDELRDLRSKYKTNPKYWYSCHRGRSIRLFEKPRIISPEISLGCNMTLDARGLYHNTKVYSLVPSGSENILYWLGLLNSKLLWWFLSNTGYVLRGGYFCFKTNYLNPFPIRMVNLSDAGDKFRHDQIAELAEEALRLHYQVGKGKGGAEIKERIVTTNRQIDQLVYELYGLTFREIENIETASAQLLMSLGD